MTATHLIKPQTSLRLEKIAVLTDFSPTADLALRWAATLARNYGAEIILAHAYVPPSCAYSAPELAIVFETIDACRENLEDRLMKTTHEPFLKDIHCTIALCPGEPSDLLEELTGADLIVVGTSGQAGLRKSLLGSTAEHIFRTCPKPVVTVGPHCRCTGEGKAALELVLCAVDLNPGAERTLSYALSIARQHDAEFLLLHVVEGDDINLALEQACARAEGLEALRRLMTGDAPYSKTTFVVDFGDADSDILNQARRYGASLIVMGARRSKVPALASRFAGGTAYTVAANAECPVMTIPHFNGGTVDVTGVTESQQCSE